MEGSELGKHGTGAFSEPLGQRPHERMFTAKSLHQPAGCHAGLASDVREGEFVRSPAAHGALSRGEHAFVGYLQPRLGHLLDTR
jgi:hypothetical protein